MSYPSISEICQKEGLNIATAPDEELRVAIARALEKDLPLGVAFLKDMAEKVTSTGNRLLESVHPSSEVGKQLIRICGTDVGRAVASAHFCQGHAIGFYNCCSPVMAPTVRGLNISFREQIELQNGTLASADC